MIRSAVFYCLLIILAAWVPAVAQTTAKWYMYHDSKKDLYGYKDGRGHVKVPARFNSMIKAWTFRNIIAVSDGYTNTSYHLLKSGKQVAKDSLYVWDMTYDCEQEGKIRFHDPVTDKVGFLDITGKIAIPAAFNDARPFYNNLALVIHNAERLCGDGKPYQPDCEHWYWQGTTALIDRTGNIIADSLNINATENINWYSLKITDEPAGDKMYTSIKGTQNKYYTFINYKSEFEQWFYQKFLPQINTSRLTTYYFDEVTVEGMYKNVVRKTYNRSAFAKKYGTLLQKKLKVIQLRRIETAVFDEELNLFIYNNGKYKSYYTDCGDANTARYPLFEIITTRYGNHHQFDYQEHFSFLRTAHGYKLIAVAFRNRR